MRLLLLGSILAAGATGLLAPIARAADPDVPTPPAPPPPAAQRNPAAPPETDQFAFLIGTWDCSARFLTADGSYAETEATWIGTWILDGWAIQDFWIRTKSDGTQFQGTNIRSFNPGTGKWDNRWLPMGTLRWSYYESGMVGDTMVMTGGEGTDSRGPYVDRNTFHDIGPDGWSWRKDRSYDGGETWVEGVGLIDAVRAGS